MILRTETGETGHPISGEFSDMKQKEGTGQNETRPNPQEDETGQSPYFFRKNILFGIASDTSHERLNLLMIKKRKRWSGKRVSNPRPSAWEADALPTELFPLTAKGLSVCAQTGPYFLHFPPECQGLFPGFFQKDSGGAVRFPGGLGQDWDFAIVGIGKSLSRGGSGEGAIRRDPIGNGF